jgi:hypothetical protein
MSEVDAKFVCVDNDTNAIIRNATQAFSSHDLIFLSVGDSPVDGATHISELVNDDGSGCYCLIDRRACTDIIFITKSKLFPKT